MSNKKDTLLFEDEAGISRAIYQELTKDPGALKKKKKGGQCKHYTLNS